MAILNLQYEIEKNMNEIELLKQKLQVKNQVLGNLQGPMSLKARESYFMRPTTSPADCGIFCGMGPNGESTTPSANRGTIANFMQRETVKNAVEPSEGSDEFFSDLGVPYMGGNDQYGRPRKNPPEEMRPTIMQYKDPNLIGECNIF